MTEFLIANMAPIMFSALLVFLLIGYPVAFSLAAVGMAFGLLGIELGLLAGVERELAHQPFLELAAATAGPASGW